MPLTRDDVEIVYDRHNDVLFTVRDVPGYFRWSWNGGATASPWLQRGSRYDFGETLVRANRAPAISELLDGLNDGRFTGLPDDVLQARAWNRMVDTFGRKIDMLRAELNGHQPRTAAHERYSRDLRSAEAGLRGTLGKLQQAALEDHGTRTARESAAMRAMTARAELTPDAASQLLSRGGFPIGALTRLGLPS